MEFISKIGFLFCFNQLAQPVNIWYNYKNRYKNLEGEV